MCRLYFTLFLLIFFAVAAEGAHRHLSFLIDLGKPKPSFEGKKKGWFYAIKIEEFEEFYVLHLKRRNKLYKVVAPKNKHKECREISLNERYFFSLKPMLGVIKNMAMHPMFNRTDYYNQVIEMESDSRYALNIYEIKNRKGKEGICVIFGR